MLKEILYCDRCGHIIESDNFTIGYNTRYDLCIPCSKLVHKKIERFLKDRTIL